MSMYFDLGRDYTKLEMELIEENSRLKESLKKSELYNRDFLINKIEQQTIRLNEIKEYYVKSVKPLIIEYIQKPLTIENKMKLEDIVRHFLHKFEINIMVDVIQIDENTLGFWGASLTDQIIWNEITSV